MCLHNVATYTDVKEHIMQTINAIDYNTGIYSTDERWNNVDTLASVTPVTKALLSMQEHDRVVWNAQAHAIQSMEDGYFEDANPYPEGSLASEVWLHTYYAENSPY
jgi:hypothetical protein